ncbi:CerR family C-terminal domain-containing protein [Spiribacter halobius]|uniref:DUF1956 domain-containing protein n=1 Tax=Sediminicurvatus halobius TaxID=2182432 RepID=A0A2U2N3H0_9GAMM|nr:CerR family C-terminal domain-containing protein [Spiribacter halobius]PWG63519.1 DUF1956 domain-containing protein [Spiribacter halobius]UEX79609.1 CerR family C-terminal domain-containing protein [Spiribacter halobius]
MSTESTLPPRGDVTREALIATAMQAFARDGFDAASTRAIARDAGVNQALIGYHFGGKRGLYLACFEHIVERVRRRIAPALRRIDEQLNERPADAAGRCEAALEALFGLTDAFADVMISGESAAWAQLILREQQAPTDAFRVVLEGFMEPVLRCLTRLIAMARGEREAEAHRLRAITVVGQVLVFRTCRAGMLHHLGWDDVGASEAAIVRRHIRATVGAVALG